MSWLHLRHTGLEWIAQQISKKRFFKKVKKVCNFNRICNDDLFKLLKSSSKIRKNRKDLCKEALMLFLIKYNEQTLQIPEVFYYPVIFCPTVLLKELHTLSLKQDILKNTRKATVSHSFILKLLYLPIEIIWQSPMEEMFLFAEEGR